MKKPEKPIVLSARTSLHRHLIERCVLTAKAGVPSNADSSSRISRELACFVLERVQKTTGIASELRASPQTAGSEFEKVIVAFLNETFLSLTHLRPGAWSVRTGDSSVVLESQQFLHLRLVERAAEANHGLAAALGTDYIVKPDVVVLRSPETDEIINAQRNVVDDTVARCTGLRLKNSSRLLLHASVSCKWTMRSDRAQNSRSEALNLIRNRKGRVPHIAVVTAEPMPSRLASIALGTGDIDCVYHVFLDELMEAVEHSGHEDSVELMQIMVQGDRLRDVADLPFDLVV